ncbi:hypothetical protein QBC34DRAFT_400458 [Podospora aff. communis PSN243]|uniref:C3H1-type domain-containing protein n=1 Tax=Podospora aff. communis PSN243 TaxID=3040156 RepID=A0AAV9GVE7_9PEZI|nr:hypothetical protein QBC34DRAFT_400458 [Podospora aff. communis PSN243]
MVSQPLFFLVRPGVTVQTPSGPMQTQPGSIVPLIAIDELPDWIEIVGAPRQLTVQQTIGMANLGSFVKSDGTYPVRIAYDAAGDDSSSDGEEVKPSWADLVEEMRDDCGIGERRDAEIGTASVVPPTPAVSPVQLNTPAPGQPQTPSQPQPSPSNSNNTRATDIHPADRMKAHWAVNQPARHAGLSASIHNQPPEAKQTPPTTQQATTPTISSTCTASTQPMPQSVDEYCRHWCHHGTCKWGLQCRYKHSMPTTPSGLLEVGLSEFPTWWLAKVLIGDTSALALGNKNSSSSSPPSGDINLAAAAAALGMGGLGGLATPYPRQANAQNLGLNLARDYYARQLGVMRGLRLGLGSQGGGVSNKKLKAQLREAVGLLRELGTYFSFYSC